MLDLRVSANLQFDFSLNEAQQRSMESIVIEYRPESVRAIEAAVLAVTSAGDRVILDLSALDTLDTAGVRGLIELLRLTRSTSGELALRASRAEVLRTLSVTGLDKLFPLVEAQAA
jgi:anti-anti-sigma factor